MLSKIRLVVVSVCLWTVTGAALLGLVPPCAAHAQETPLVPRPNSKPTPEDPLNYAKEGHSPEDIKALYRMRRQDELCEKARQWVTQKHFRQAITQYQAVLEKDKNCSQAWFGLAEAYEAAGNTREAIDAYEFLFTRENHPHFSSDLDSDPRYVERLVLLLHRNRLYDEAWKWHQRAMELDKIHDVERMRFVKDIPLDARSAATPLLPFVAHLVIASYELGGLRTKDAPEPQNKAVAHARAAVRLRSDQTVGHLCLGASLVQQARALESLHGLYVNYGAKNPGKFDAYADPSILDKVSEIRAEARRELDAVISTGSAAMKAKAQIIRPG